MWLDIYLKNVYTIIVIIEFGHYKFGQWPQSDHEKDYKYIVLIVLIIL